MTSTPSGLRFKYEWEPGDGVRAPELAATWCRLEIWVDSECVSRVEDRVSSSTRRSIYCSLYPLAEWVAFNWWLLQAHVRPSAVNPRFWSFSRLALDDDRPRGWLWHHNLRAVGDGFLWPDMTVVPEGATTRIAWTGDRRPDSAALIRFVSSGESETDANETLGVLTTLVESVLTRLREAGVDDSLLEQEWRANDELSADERDFCVAAARLGLDPYTTGDEVTAALLDVSEQLDVTLIEPFLDAVDAAEVSRGLRWIATSTEQIATARGASDDRLVAIQGALRGTPSMTARPWIVGYEQALTARHTLGLESTHRAAPEELMALLPAVGVDRGLQGLGGTSNSGSPALVLTSRANEPVERFAAARALWHFGAPPSHDRFLLTPARTTAHKTERAFAAEFLAPADGLRALLPVAPEVLSDDDLDTAAAHYGVSPLLIRHQVDNQLLGA